MALRKNVKRIDPRYFLNETVDRDEDGSRLEEDEALEEGWMRDAWEKSLQFMVDPLGDHRKAAARRAKWDADFKAKLDADQKAQVGGVRPAEEGSGKLSGVYQEAGRVERLKRTSPKPGMPGGLVPINPAPTRPPFLTLQRNNTSENLSPATEANHQGRTIGRDGRLPGYIGR